MGKIAVIAIILCVLTAVAPMLIMGNTDNIPEKLNIEKEYTIIQGKDVSDEETAEVLNVTEEIEESSSDSMITIPVLVSGKVRYLQLDEYLQGVLAAEMPASFPDEALKAQAVAARTYIIRKRTLVEAGEPIDPAHKGAIMCDDYTHCSAYTDIAVNAADIFGSNAEIYAEKIADAVRETDGVIMTYAGEPITAAFHAISGGMTENASDVWGNDVPYLRSVESVEDETAAMYRSTVTYSTDEFRALMTSGIPDADLSGEPESWFKNYVRSDAGGIITVEIGGAEVKGTALRSLLCLASTDFTVEHKDNSIIFNSVGYGHGVGMSQYGAKRMADEGKTYDEILKHYYSGVDITVMEEEK